MTLDMCHAVSVGYWSKENCESEAFEDVRSFDVISMAKEEILLQGEEDGASYLLTPVKVKGLEYKQYWN